MKGFLILTVAGLFCIAANAQQDSNAWDRPKNLAKAKLKYEQDEIKMENAFFKNQYHPKTYKKYSGNIFTDTTHGSTFVQFDSIRVYLFEGTDSLKSIFTSGLLSGQMLYCTLDSSCEATPEIGMYDSLGKLFIEDLWGWTGHTIEIDYFGLLTNVKSKPTERRFKFWVYPYKIRMNGGNDILFLELTNENADDKTDIETFIKGAKVTFLKRGWSMI